jgi:Ca2+-binding EF-hand superfamily protein
LRAAGRLPSEAVLLQLRKCLQSETFTFADLMTMIPKFPLIGKSVVRVALIDIFQQFDEIGIGMVTTEEAKIVLCDLGASLKAELAVELIGLADPAGKGFVKYSLLINQLISK